MSTLPSSADSASDYTPDDSDLLHLFASLQQDQEDDLYHIDEQLRDVTYHVAVPKVSPRATKTTTIAICDTIGSCTSRRMLRVLFDSGSDKTYINRRVIPKDTQLITLEEVRRATTLAGTLTCDSLAILRNIKLPEFDKNRTIESQKALVFNSNSRYDVILGNDFLDKAGINLLFEHNKMTWLGLELPMRTRQQLRREDYDAMVGTYVDQEEDEFMGEDWLDAFTTSQILDAKYDKVTIDEVIAEQTHLNDAQKEDLHKVLSKFERLFSGKLGVYPHKKFHIDIDPNATPVHSRAYAVPRIHEATFKKELEHLVHIGVLSHQGASEWASGTFIIPKKDGRVRWVSDLRQLNKVIRRRTYPLPIINDILRRRTGYSFFTKLDISMQYYTFELDEESKDLCTIVTPFGKYKYNRLAMGLKCAPDIAQEVMENVLRGLDDTEVYIDDVGCFSNKWEHHLKLLDEVLQRLQDNGFTINPLKCEWAVQETDWLGYWLTPRGLKPWKKKIDAILKMSPPRTRKELRMFIGAVNYYRDMWPSRAHVLAPLTKATGEETFKWTPEMQHAFTKMKQILCADALCAYPDHNKGFVIYTDASDLQLGACIMQDGRPIAYYSKKLNPAQRNYNTREKELLSIVMTLLEYRSLLLGAKLTIYTDHKNLTFDKLSSQRVLRWRCFVDEYDVTLKYIEGKENILADNLSRLPRLGLDEVTEGKNSPADPLDDAQWTDDYDLFHNLAADLDDDLLECFDCYLSLPETAPEESPLNYAWMRTQQQADPALLAKHQRHPERYVYKTFNDDIQLLCYIKPGLCPRRQWKFALSESMLMPIIKWFHIALGHPGSKRLRLALQLRYHHEDLRRKIDSFACDACQRHKLTGPGYGLLPARDVKECPFEEVAVDLIGPWKVTVRGRAVEFNALTCIDPVTNLVELVRIDNKTSSHIKTKFENTWLARYT